MDNLKSKILYSEIISTLIQTSKVLAVYLGGSRLLGLDSPESDYDIIVIAEDNSLNNYQRASIPLDNYKVHVHIHSFENVISLIANPLLLDGFQNCLVLIDSILLDDSNLIYISKKYEKIKHIILKYKEPLTVLCLETRLNAIYNTISYPIVRYNKRYYHYLLMYFLLTNFIKDKKLFLTEAQTITLKEFKSKAIIPAIFKECLNHSKPHKYYTSLYNYIPIYKEMKLYE
jgi:predicted nucleotidyltransferase